MLRQMLQPQPGEKRVLPLLQAAASGLVIFVLMSVVPTALGFVSYGLGLSALTAMALCGLWLAYRAGILSVLGATFVALLPAALAVGGADDFKAARRTVEVTIPVADAPRHAEADVLILTDLRVAAEFTVTWKTSPPSGGPEMHHAMVPLVPTGWQRGTLVPAWRVCSGGEPAWCRRALSYPVHAVRRVDDRDGRYRLGMMEMASRFGLTPAPGAPLLQLTTPPGQRAEAAVTGMIAMPVLGFMAWLLGLLLWRSVRRLRQGAG